VGASKKRRGGGGGAGGGGERVFVGGGGGGGGNSATVSFKVSGFVQRVHIKRGSVLPAFRFRLRPP